MSWMISSGLLWAKWSITAATTTTTSWWVMATSPTTKCSRDSLKYIQRPSSGPSIFAARRIRYRSRGCGQWKLQMEAMHSYWLSRYYLCVKTALIWLSQLYSRWRGRFGIWDSIWWHLYCWGIWAKNRKLSSRLMARATWRQSVRISFNSPRFSSKHSST